MRVRRFCPVVLSAFAAALSAAAIGASQAGAQTPEEDAEGASPYCYSMTMCTPQEEAEGKKLRCLTLTECEAQDPGPSIDPAIKEGFDRQRTANRYAYKRCRAKAKETVNKRKRKLKLQRCTSKYPAVVR